MTRRNIHQTNSQQKQNNTPREMIYCPQCKKYKEKFLFGTNENTDNGLNWICRTCVALHYDAQKQRKNQKIINARNRARYTDEEYKAITKEHLKRRARKRNYKLEHQDYENMLFAQNGACAICGKPETKIINGQICDLSVDHDHKTGIVRGLLCGACNLGLGAFKDNIENLSNAIDYLMGLNR